MAVRKPLIDFIQNQLAPADMVAIMYPLTPTEDGRLDVDATDLDAPAEPLAAVEPVAQRVLRRGDQERRTAGPDQESRGQEPAVRCPGAVSGRAARS